MKKLIGRDIDHITPVGDKFKHTCKEHCRCNPEIKVYGDYLQVIHNAFDLREFSESAYSYSRYRN